MTDRERGDYPTLDRERLVLIAVGTTFLSLLPTAFVAFISTSTTLLADLLRCVGEFFAILVSWLVLRRMSSGDSKRFNYGYGKLEQLGGIAVAAALFLTFLVSLFSGIRGLISPQQVENAQLGFFFAGLSVVGNGFMWAMNYITDSKQPSPIAESQWRLFRAKTCATLVVMVSLATALHASNSFLKLYIDPIGTIALSVFMLWQAYTLTSASVPDLIDYAIEESLQGALDTIVEEHRHLYVKVEQVRSRRNPQKVFIEIFLSFEPQLPFHEVHNRVMTIKRAIEARFPRSDVTVIPSLPA
jgi:cation diffusion facilitator family transporter